MDAYDQGYRDYYDFEDENPYHLGTMDYENWEDGWLDAEYDASFMVFVWCI